MSAALAAMAFSAIETEIARRGQRAGDDARTRRHGGWAVIFCALGLFCAITHWIFG